MHRIVAGPRNDVAMGEVERLGRPAINEGLVVSNSLLNAFNSVPPSADLSSNATVVAVRTEAATTLAATYYAGNVLSGSVAASGIQLGTHYETFGVSY